MKSFLRTASAVLFAVLFMTAVSSAQQITLDSVNFKGATNVFNIHHNTGAPTSSCTGTTQYVQDDDTTGNPFWVCKSGTMVHLGGIPTLSANLGAATTAAGVLTTVPEKGFTTSSGVTSVAWDEDAKNGRFDCRNPAYAGGCLGPTPGLAMQAFSDALVCYQSMTGKHATTYFPPGIIAVGTPTQPTLKLPTGASYWGRAGYGFGSNATEFQATYNNHRAVEIDNNLTSTTNCSDGVQHTSNMGGGAGGGWTEHGCGQGGCVNVPGDNGNYPFGGPSQAGIGIFDDAGSYGIHGGIFASANGAEGVECGGLDEHCYELGGSANMAWYIFGHTQSGQTYNPTTDVYHCNVMLTGLDNINDGPFETYGDLDTPGAEYGHLCGTMWAGGNSYLGPIFSNRDQIGLMRLGGGGSNGRAIGGRIDAPMGEGIVVTSQGNSFTGIDNSSACSGFSTVARGTVFGQWISSLGSGMTDGTYVIPAVNGSGDTTGSGATLTLTVSGGVATNLVVSNPGSLYVKTPTFPVTGTGGTPAVIGATTYQHCDKLDDIGGHNSYSGVKNIFEGFFGTDYSTGDIWTGAALGETFDRGTVGTLERLAIPNILASPKGNGSHKDLLDPFAANGGISVTGPAVSFMGGNHFISGDTTTTSWTGPFQFENVMQDIWIYANNANTTLPVSAGWRTCTGYDLNLAPVPTARWLHFFIFQDDSFSSTPGTGMIFKEQCDTINRNTWDVNWDGNPSSIPLLESQGVLDVLGSGAFHALPAPGTFGGQSGGTPGPNGIASTNNYVYVVWTGSGKVVSALSATFSQCLPLPGFVNNPCFQNVIFNLPQNWLRYQLYRNTATDSIATAGLILDVTAPNNVPQPAGSTSWEDTRIAPINGTTIPSAWYGVTVTGTLSSTGMTIPTGSSFPGIAGQMIRDEAGGFDYYCDADDHWKRTPITWSTF